MPKPHSSRPSTSSGKCSKCDTHKTANSILFALQGHEYGPLAAERDTEMIRACESSQWEDPKIREWRLRITGSADPFKPGQVCPCPSILHFAGLESMPYVSTRQRTALTELQHSTVCMLAMFDPCMHAVIADIEQYCCPLTPWMQTEL